MIPPPVVPVGPSDLRPAARRADPASPDDSGRESKSGSRFILFCRVAFVFSALNRATMTVAKRIKQIRTAGGLTQGLVAKHTKITQSALCQLEKGQTTPTLRTLRRLAKALSVTPSDLLR